MRCRLLTGYRKQGRLLPAGSVIDLDEKERKVLGEGAVPVEEPQPESEAKPEPESDSLTATLREMDASDPGREHPDWWTRTGKPEVAELRRRGHALPATERDEAWERYLESRTK